MQKQVDTLRHVVVGAISLGALFLAGTIGFAVILHETAFEAFYRTVITVFTAGLVTPPTSLAAEIFTIVVVVWGVAVFFYIFGFVLELFVSGSITGDWVRRRTRRRVERLSDHYIICGFGRVGQRIGTEFRQAGARYVVIDFSSVAQAAARERDELLIEGSGTEDSNLIAAGIERARGLVASSDSDSDNLYITLSARAMRPDLLIVARASTEEAAKKLELAGADRVVQPYSTAGQEMAKLVLKPQVAAFLDAVSWTGGPDLRFEEIVVDNTSQQTGRTIKDLNVRSRTGALIIALRKRDGTFDTTPNPDAVIDDGDVMICVGTPAELVLLEEMFAPNQAVAR
jgi:voltage-gated potassium channel